MTLTQEQAHQIAAIDRKVKAVLSVSRDEGILLVEMLEFMPAIKPMIEQANPQEIDMYANAYQGFYHYMKVLERLAQSIKDGTSRGPVLRADPLE